MQTNCLAVAKLVQNKKLGTLRLLVTFDKSKRDNVGNIIVTVRNAAFATGDICNTWETAERKEYAIARAIKQAEAALRTNNIQLL